MSDASKPPADPPVLVRDLVATILKSSTLPEPSEQVNNLIVWLATNTDSGHYVEVDPPRFAAITGCVDGDGVWLAVDHLQTEGFLLKTHKTETRQTATGTQNYGFDAFALSLRGWERYQDIARGALNSRRAFMAMPFNETAETQALLNRVYRDYLRKAARAAGFDLIRLDDDPTAGSIDDRIRVEIRRSRFLIAELTTDNRGAYWEAGFAEGSRKPVIYTCREDYTPNVHFDANHHLIIKWDPTNLDKLVTDTKYVIRATLPSDAKLHDDDES